MVRKVCLVVLMTALMSLMLPVSLAQQETPPPKPTRQWASGASASSQYGSDSWSALQAAGQPNVTSCSDSGSAWASATYEGRETLTLSFERAVIPSQINIHQTYNPGAIIQVKLANSATGEESTLPDSADPVGNTPCPGVFSLEVDDFGGPVDTVIIEFDMSLVGNWNEIDAVELVGLAQPEVRLPAPISNQWAASASATSQYGDDNWSAAQATGEPNTESCGDQVTAWASRDSTGQDSITLSYAEPVIPLQVNVHQTYNPGAITQVALANSATDQTFALPDSADPVGNTPCPGVFRLTPSAIGLVDQVTLTLDQTLTGSWNEIDAVEVVGIALSDSVTSGDFNIYFPSGWVTNLDSDGFLDMASDQATLDFILSDATEGLPAASLALSFAFADNIATLGLEGSTPLDLVTEFVTLAEASSEVTPYPTLGENAVISLLEGSSIAPDGAVLIGTTYGGEPVLLAVQIGEGLTFADVESLVVGILQAIQPVEAP
jgi:hypothetical protein